MEVLQRRSLDSQKYVDESHKARAKALSSFANVSRFGMSFCGGVLRSSSGHGAELFHVILLAAWLLFANEVDGQWSSRIVWLFYQHHQAEN